MRIIPGKHHASSCGRCDDYIDENGCCWCESRRDPIVGIQAKFPSPVCDNSDGSFWREEVDILRVIREALRRNDKSPLVKDRGYVKDLDTYGVCFYWNTAEYQRQWDGPVSRLWSRLLIRPVRCAGSFTWLVLTDAALDAIDKADKKIPK